MTKHCNECKQPLTFAERWGIRKHICDEDILAALAYKAQEAHKNYLEAKRQQQETAMLQREALRIRQQEVARFNASVPVRSSGSSRRVSSSDDSFYSGTNNAVDFSSVFSSSDSSSSYSSSCDSSSSSSDSGSCSSGD